MVKTITDFMWKYVDEGPVWRRALALTSIAFIVSLLVMGLTTLLVTLGSILNPVAFTFIIIPIFLFLLVYGFMYLLLSNS